MGTKNFQIIEGAQNDIFPVYQVSCDLFDLIFPDDTDVAFIDEVNVRVRNSSELSNIPEDERWALIYSNPQNKKTINGLHGTLHLTGSPCRREFFPDRKEETVIERKMIS